MLSPTLDLVEYYANLLIIQYLSKPRARATIKTQIAPVLMPQVSVQVISFSAVPTSGSFSLYYGDTANMAAAYDADAAYMQAGLRTITGSSTLTVTGDFTVGFTVTFHDVAAPAILLVNGFNTLLISATPVSISIVETDVTLPIAVENAFNLNPPTNSSQPALASGIQLDIIGKYVGVTRVFQGRTGPVVLVDSDYFSLIRLAVLTNSAQSDLASIQALIAAFFVDQIRVFDYQNMRMSYLISTAVGSRELLEAFLSQGLLPRPMGVQVASIIYAPDIDNFFGFCSYEAPFVTNVKPFNSYEDYQENWPWLDYAYAVTI